MAMLTHEDWKMLLERDPQKVENCSEFSDAIRLFYDKESVAHYNMTKLQSLSEPVARINTIHSCVISATAKPDDAGGLHPVVFLAVGARVIRTSNLWQEVGLCNGAAGTVHQILYHEGHRPPDLPISVIVDFDEYNGPTFIPDHPKCIPVSPIIFEWQSDAHKLSREQLPLQVSYAITIHKSQGQTFQKAVIDIGKHEFAAGSTFVAISRLPSLQCALIQPMPFERLQVISRGRSFTIRMEEVRLQNMCHT